MWLIIVSSLVNLGVFAYNRNKVQFSPVTKFHALKNLLFFASAMLTPFGVGAFAMRALANWHQRNNSSRSFKSELVRKSSLKKEIANLSKRGYSESEIILKTAKIAAQQGMWRGNLLDSWKDMGLSDRKAMDKALGIYEDKVDPRVEKEANLREKEFGMFEENGLGRKIVGLKAMEDFLMGRLRGLDLDGKKAELSVAVRNLLLNGEGLPLERLRIIASSDSPELEKAFLEIVSKESPLGSQRESAGEELNKILTKERAVKESVSEGVEAATGEERKNTESKGESHGVETGREELKSEASEETGHLNPGESQEVGMDTRTPAQKTDKSTMYIKAYNKSVPEGKKITPAKKPAKKTQSATTTKKTTQKKTAKTTRTKVKLTVS